MAKTAGCHPFSVIYAQDTPMKLNLITALFIVEACATPLTAQKCAKTQPRARFFVWRDTTSAEWANSVFVKDVTTYTVKGISKGSYFFGLHAVNKESIKSRSSTPVRP